MGGGGWGCPQPLEGGQQGLQVSWLLVACSTTLRAAQQLVRGAAGNGVAVVQVGNVIVCAGAGDLAVQAPPQACQELLGEGRQGGLDGDPARLWPYPPGYEDGG